MEKVIDLEDRIPTLRQRRKRRTNFKFIILTTIFALVLLFLLYLQSSYSKIQTITIEGDKIEQQDFYIEQAGFAIGDSIWSFKPHQVEEKIEELEWVREVEVKRHLLTKVSIKLDEYAKVAYIKEQNHYFPILENGYIFDQEVDIQLIDAPVFIGFEDEKLRKRLVKELAKVDASTLALISQINADPTDADPYAIKLFMNDGYEVRADATSLSEKIQFYPSIIAQIEVNGNAAKGIIDIEVGTYYQSYDKEYGNGVPIDVSPSDKEDSTEEGISQMEPATGQANEEEPLQHD